MDYELRLVVEKVSVASKSVVKRDTLKVYDVTPPESILDLDLRHGEQISLIGKVQNAVIAEQAKLIDPGYSVCPKCGHKLKRMVTPNPTFTLCLVTIRCLSKNTNALTQTVTGKVLPRQLQYSGLASILISLNCTVNKAFYIPTGKLGRTWRS